MWTCVGDLARYADAVRLGLSSGADATTPRFPAGGQSRIGYGWMTTPAQFADGPGVVVRHNGSAGGHTAFVGFDRARGRVVAVLSNTAEPVDGVGVRLLGADLPDLEEVPPSPTDLLLGVVLPVAGAVSFLVGARSVVGSRARSSSGGRGPVSLIAGLVGAALCLLVGSGAALPAWLVGLVGLVGPACGRMLGAGVGLWAAASRSGSGAAGVRRGAAAAGSPAPPR